MRTDTYMCTHVHACIHEYTAGEHTGYHAIVSCLKLQLDSTVCFDSDLSSMLILSDKCIFILLRPAAVVVAHDATQRDRKEWAILYQSRPKHIFLQYRCSHNIADDLLLRVSIYGNNAGMSRSRLIALCFTLSQQCILFISICWLSPLLQAFRWRFLCSDCQRIQIVSWLILESLDSKNQHKMEFFANQIRTTLVGGLKCDSNQIATNAFQSGWFQIVSWIYLVTEAIILITVHGYV